MYSEEVEVSCGTCEKMVQHHVWTESQVTEVYFSDSVSLQG